MHTDHGNIHKFRGHVIAIDGYGSSSIKVKQVLLCMQIGKLPPRSYQVFISLLPEYIYWVSTS